MSQKKYLDEVIKHPDKTKQKYNASDIGIIGRKLLLASKKFAVDIYSITCIPIKLFSH